MAGTLEVQTIQGPSSGANANKVIIPSGHTLDASGGTLMPSAGQIVQRVEDVVTNGWNNISSTSYVTIATVVITPKFTTSKIAVTGTGMFYKNNTASSTAGDGRWAVHRNGSLVNDPVFTQNGNTEQYAHYTGSGLLFIYPFSQTVNDEPATTSAVTYTFKIRSGSGGAFAYYGGFKLTAMEIKQ